MDYRGHVEDGIIRPSEPLNLPNGTPVEFHAITSNGESEADNPSGHFWANLELDELLRRSGTQPLASLDELAGDWPPEDDIEDFLRILREVRQ